MTEEGIVKAILKELKDGKSWEESSNPGYIRYLFKIPTYIPQLQFTKYILRKYKQ